MPQMPLWMGELQLVGFTPEQLTDLMRRRYRRERGMASGPPVTLRFEASWNLELIWDGPDSNATAAAIPIVDSHQDIHLGDPPLVGPQPPNHTGVWRLPAQQPPAPQPTIAVAAELRFDALGQLVDATGAPTPPNTDGAVEGAWPARPTEIPFPDANRRLPWVFVSRRTARWGLQPAPKPLPTLVIEFQPRIEDAGNEVIRGGDGTLRVATFNIDGKRIDGGLVTAGASVAAPAAGEPDLRLPTFHVRGRGPAPLPPPAPGQAQLPAVVLVDQPPAYVVAGLANETEIENLIRAVVEEEFETLRAAGSTATDPAADRARWRNASFLERPNVIAAGLAPATWQETVVRVIRHESSSVVGPVGARVTLRYHQFEPRRSGRYADQIQNPHGYWGKEYGMPLFGYPHGYGLGQIDNTGLDAGANPRGVTADEAWSFVENIRLATRMLMIEKADAAWRRLNGNAQRLSNQAIPLLRRRAVYQREVVRIYNGFNEFSWTGADWAIAPTHTPAMFSHLEYPNEVLRTAVVYRGGNPLQPLWQPIPIVFRDPGDYGPGL
jgi:hypothetical protein